MYPSNVLKPKNIGRIEAEIIGLLCAQIRAVDEERQLGGLMTSLNKDIG